MGEGGERTAEMIYGISGNNERISVSEEEMVEMIGGSLCALHMDGAVE